MRNDEILTKIEEERKLEIKTKEKSVHIGWRRGHILRRNSLQLGIIEGKMEGNGEGEEVRGWNAK